jgi:hypothetical protein
MQQKKTEDPIDICVYDVKKCFDSMWAKEAINDAFDLGFQNDKLPLVYLANENASIAIKTSSGTTERSTISNVIMQGTVWAGLLCTSTMDKLGKHIYNNPHMAYKYRGKIVVPPLKMVDNVLTVAKCGAASVTMNAVVNSFMSSKKLQLNQLKCAKIHVGKKCGECPELFAQKEHMKNSDQEKYLGDLVNKDGKQHATVVERISKGYGIVANILALINDIPLGHRRVEIGLELRQAWLVNGILYNSEVWQQLTEDDQSNLNKMDHILLRSILGAHSKVPEEQLYLETASINMSQTLSARRMIYLQTILQRSEGELIRNIYQEMKADPLKGDWSELVKSDFENFDISLNEDEIRDMDPKKYKSLIKEKVRESAFICFKEMQAGHTKGRQNQHKDLSSPQKYLLTNKLTNKQVSLLFNLKCQSVRGIKDNFHRQYPGDLLCPLCKLEADSQSHILTCSVLRRNTTINPEVKYDFIHGSLEDRAGHGHHPLLFPAGAQGPTPRERDSLPGRPNSGLLDIIVL